MNVVIFGNGPLPFEPQFPVLAPGARTWQILKTVLAGLKQERLDDQLILIALDETDRPSGETRLSFPMDFDTQHFTVDYFPLKYSAFESGQFNFMPSSSNIRAVVTTGSVLCYSVASQFAKQHNLPLWVDVFGDPLCEIQSRHEVIELEDKARETELLHIWKLFTDGLLTGDQFSTLSDRQRFSLLGQLGCAGRLNKFTAGENLVHSIPYALFTEDLPVLDPPQPLSYSDSFTVVWSGSFNTWMDVPTLTQGIVGALQSIPEIRLMVIGGGIPGYNDSSYLQFINGLKKAGVEGSVILKNWQPYSRMQELYSQCHLGLSIDRMTYEAELGSRTRLINFLAAGLPVVSTVITELSRDLQNAGILLPFEMGNPASLTETILSAYENRDSTRLRGLAGREYITKRYNAHSCGKNLMSWIASPTAAKDNLSPSETNNLRLHTQQVRKSLNT